MSNIWDLLRDLLRRIAPGTDPHNASASEIEIMAAYHRVLLQHIRSLDQEFIKILIPLVTAVGGYGCALSKTTAPVLSPHDALILTAAALGALTILGWALYYVLALSNNYRVLQAVMSRLEREIGIDKVLPLGWNPCNPCDKFSPCGFFEFLPTIFKAHFLALSCAILGILVIHLWALNSLICLCCDWIRWGFPVLAMLVLGIALIRAECCLRGCPGSS